MGYQDGSIALLSPDLSVLAELSVCNNGLASVRLLAGDTDVVYACADGLVGIARLDHALGALSMLDSFSIEGAVAKLRVDDSGRWVIVANKANVLYIYDTLMRAVTRREGQLATINAISTPSSDFERVLVGDLNGTVRVWKLPMNVARTIHRASGSVHTLAIARSDQSAIISGLDGVVRSVDLENGRVSELGAHSKTVYSIRVTPHGVLSYSLDGTARVWGSGTPRVFASHGAVNDAGFLDGGRAVSVGDDGRLFAWTMTGDQEKLLFKHSEPLVELEVLKDSGHVVVNDRTGAIWDVGPEGVVIKVRKPDGLSLILRASPDGRWLAVGTNEGTVILYDTRSWVIVRTLATGGGVRQIAFDPKGRDLVIASENGVLSAVSFNTQGALSWREFPAMARDIAYHPGGDLIAFVCAEWCDMVLFKIRSSMGLCA